MKRWLSILLMLNISGCAVPYVPPNSGPVTTIRFINESSRKLEIAYFEESQGCKRRRTAPMIFSGEEAQHTVRANSDLTFQYYLTSKSIGGEQYCLTNLRFFPKDSEKYIFRTTDDSSECKWVMYEESDVNRSNLIKLESIPWSRGVVEDSSWCDK